MSAPKREIWGFRSAEEHWDFLKRSSWISILMPNSHRPNRHDSTKQFADRFGWRLPETIATSSRQAWHTSSPFPHTTLNVDQWPWSIRTSPGYSVNTNHLPCRCLAKIREISCSEFVDLSCELGHTASTDWLKGTFISHVLNSTQLTRAEFAASNTAVHVTSDILA